MIDLVLCGFQTGADIGGARAARAAGLPTGGWMPAGYLAEDGPRPEFAESEPAAYLGPAQRPPHHTGDDRMVGERARGEADRPDAATQAKEQVTCHYCGKPADPDYLFECPECYRDGCESCMPAGRGCLCPECEEADEPEEDEDGAVTD